MEVSPSLKNLKFASSREAVKLYGITAELFGVSYPLAQELDDIIDKARLFGTAKPLNERQTVEAISVLTGYDLQTSGIEHELLLQDMLHVARTAFVETVSQPEQVVEQTALVFADSSLIAA